MNKTGAKLAGSTHSGRYTPWNGSLSRPILRTYSAEVTSPGEQSPASSQCTLSQALAYCTTRRHRKSRSFLPIFQSFFMVLGRFSGSPLCNMLNSPIQAFYSHLHLRQTPAHSAMPPHPAKPALRTWAGAKYQSSLPVPAERLLSRFVFSTPRPSKPYAWRACHSRRTRRPAFPAGRGCTGR